MEVLTGASRTRISKCNFSNIGGNQNNYYYTIHKEQQKSSVNKDPPGLSEYTEVKRGDIYKDKDICYSWRLCSSGKDGTEGAVYTAELNIAGSFGLKKFTVKTYCGKNALEEWRRDFLRCSTDWRGNVPLFGYKLVPLAHIEDQLTYAGLYYISLMRADLGCASNELWADPTKGKFCGGPAGPKCSRQYYDYKVPSIPLDMELVKGDVVNRYFASMKYDRWFLNGLSFGGNCKHVRDTPATNFPQVTTDSGNPIAFSQKIQWICFKDSFGDPQIISHAVKSYPLIDNNHHLEVVSGGAAASWLSQALNIFCSHNISLDEDLSIYKFSYSTFVLSGTLQRSKLKRKRRQLCAPIYFIIALSPPSTLLHCCSTSLLHTWSLDQAGQIPLGPDMCKYLGLPYKLSLKTAHFSISWPTKVYKAIQDYQIDRQFDPKSVDFAHFLGYTLFNTVVAENRLQELVEEQDNASQLKQIFTVHNYIQEPCEGASSL
ncbi:hypothetical protein L218DRAFT_1003822 [Marasmius fiardii PR-910]|nr:hypothetical protein L218DRAFT_1003822 [Marasmius fiardii PR-910]